MHWYNGSIPEAIMASKQRKLPFIVYIEGQDESSTEMKAVWDDSKVTEFFSTEKCVCIKLENGSEECQQFSQLYPVVCVPSTFFIGDNGMPLEVVGGAVTGDALTEKAKAAYEAFQQQVSTALPSDQTPQSSSSDAQEANSISTSNIEERVEKAKRLIEEKRREKAEKEKKEKIEKESFRREEGQKMMQTKHEIEDRKQKELVNQIREERAKEKAARDAVRKQIAQDKVDREARRLEEIQERKSTQPSTSTSDSSQSPSTLKTSSTTARIQFRLPGGSSVMETFQADALLEAARQFIESHLDSKSITLTTVYPRRQLTEQDMIMTLSALGLTPSSTLIVSTGSSAVSSSSHDSSGVLMMLFAPFLASFNFIKMFIFGGSDHPKGSYGGDKAHQREEVKTDNRQTASTPNSELRKRAGNQGDQGNQGGSSTQQGNIHRFRNQDDDDDENNTWNGNSTQQM